MLALVRKRPRLRILEINKFYFPHVGGVERVVTQLSEGLSRRKARVIVLACNARPGQGYVSRRNGVVVVYARSYCNLLSMPISLSFFIIFFRLCRLVDLVHWHEPFPLATLATLFVRRGKPLLVTWHSDIVRQRLSARFIRILHKRVLDKTTTIVPTSRRLGAHSPVLRLFLHKQNPIAIGVNIAETTVIDPAAEREWLENRRPAPRFALFVGRLSYYKGIDTLLAAACACTATIVIIGQGSLRSYVERTIAELGLEDRVIYISRHVGDAELRMFFKHCDFLVLPSCEPSEAFGIVQLEAMAFGKPVINTDLPTGVPWVSVDGETGLTVPARDTKALAHAIQRLWEDATARGQLGHQAAERVARLFSEEQMIDSYWKVIAAAVGLRQQSQALAQAEAGKRMA